MSNAILSRNRICDALRHSEPDQIPRDLGGTESSSLSAYAYEKLKLYYNFKEAPYIYEPFQYVAHTSNMLRKYYSIDTINLTLGPCEWKKIYNPAGFEVQIPGKWKEVECKDGSTLAINEKGYTIAKRTKDGFYFDPINPIMENISYAKDVNNFKDAILSFDWPFFADETMENFKARALEMNESGYFVVFNMCCHILAAGQILRGYENFMVDMILNKTIVHEIFENLIEGYFERIKKLSPLIKDNIDIVLLNDDLGTQKGPMLSPDLYKKIVKPYQKRLFSQIKKEFSKPILFHSCGSISRFLPDLIEIGVDAINPVQLNAKDMNLKDLKNTFGKDITFWGGGIDTQSVLNKGTAKDVKDSIKRNIDILAPGGGFVFCQVHNIQNDVPVENIEAMYETLDSYR